MNDQEIEIDSRDTLSDSHKSYMERFIAWELARQEKASDSFLSRRKQRRDDVVAPKAATLKIYSLDN